MPSICKRGQTYRITVSLGYDMNGKQIRKTCTFRPPAGVSEGKAEKLARAYAYDYEKKCFGRVNLNENIRFQELADWYYEQIAPFKLKEKSLRSSRYMLDTYVIPAFGNLRLRDLTPTRIDDLFIRLRREERTKEFFIRTDKRPFSKRRILLLAKANVSKAIVQRAERGEPLSRRSAERISSALGKKPSDLFTVKKESGGLGCGSIRRIKNTLSPIFTAAVKKGILTGNPVLFTTIPKETEQERPFLDTADCKRLLKLTRQFHNPQLTRAVRLLILTGLRVGELMALHWDAVDFQSGVLEVRHTLYRLDGEYRLSSPKTRSSQRKLALPRAALETLTEQKEWQERLRAECGADWNAEQIVFTSRAGGYMNASYLNNALRNLLRKNGMPPVHIHDLRHANASILINMGVPVKIISEHLGHLDTKTTETVYAHLFQDSLRQTASAMNRAFPSASKP